MSSSCDYPLIVGRHAPLFASGVGSDRIQPIPVAEAGRLDRHRDLAFRSRIIANELEGWLLGRRLGRQADRLTVEGPVALCVLGHRAIVELVAEMAALLQLERG